nr:hypothetical protein [uncultured Campylobacter sp.]
MFLIIIPIFLALCVLFAYLYAYVLYGVLSLSKRLSVRISFFIFYAIFTLVIAFARLDIVVIMPYTIAIVILSILILKRKGYFTNFTKVRVAMAGACLLVYAWQLEVPQRLVFKTFTTLQSYPKYEIMPLEVKNDTNASFVDKVSSFRLKNMDKKLPCGLISFYCNIRSIYYSDENIKDFELVKIYGAYFARSTLFNALTIYDASAYEYYGNIDFNEIKKLINKQGENNVAK